MQDILNAIPLGIALAFMIGPVFFVLLETSVIKGFRAAMVFDLGVILADIVFIYFAYYGSRSMIEKIKDDPRLFLLGGGILCLYGFITFYKARKVDKTKDELFLDEKKNYLGLFIKGFLLNFINIGVLAFWLGIVVMVGSSLEMDGSRIFKYFTTIIVAYFLTDLLKIVLAKQLKSKLTFQVICKIKRIMGITIMIFGLVLAAKGFLPKETVEQIDNAIEKNVSSKEELFKFTV